MKIGDNWKEWTVESLLGQGSFGKVYKISRTDWGEKYESALKVIRIPQNESELSSVRSEGLDDESLEQFYRSVVDEISSECALMFQLRGNSNIVSYEDHFVEEIKDGFGWNIYIRMELLTPLVRYMSSHPFTAGETIRLGIAICRALEECGRYNIIHRDIKPENIFVSDQGEFKLGDFGIARKMEATSGMSQKGTVSYMAPEVYKSQPYNASVDLYSLGIMMYRLVNNNRAPFLPPYPLPVNYTDSEAATVRRMSGEALPEPCLAGSRLSSIILKACMYDPAARYQSASEMRRDLEALDQYLKAGKQDPVPEERLAAQEEELERCRRKIAESGSPAASDSFPTVMEVTETMLPAGASGGSSEVMSGGSFHGNSGSKSDGRSSRMSDGKQASSKKTRRYILAGAAVILAAAIAAVFMFTGQKDTTNVSSAEESQTTLEGSGKGTINVSSAEEFQAALEESGKGTIVVQPGSYEFDEPITIDRTVHIQGSQDDDGNQPVFNSSINITAGDVVLENIDINVESQSLLNEEQSAVFVDIEGSADLQGLNIGFGFSDPDIMLAGISTLSKTTIENCSIDIDNGSMCWCLSDGSAEGLETEVTLLNSDLTSSYVGVLTNSLTAEYDSLSDEDRGKVDRLVENNSVTAPIKVACYVTEDTVNYDLVELK